jgi:hypothetical protein
MILPDVLQRKSLFALLYKIDLDLAEQARARRCPFAGVLYIVPTTCESLEAGPLTYARLLKFALACAVAVKVAGAASCRHRSVFGTARFTGRRSCCWLLRCAKDNLRRSPCSGSRPFAEYGAQPSSAGNVIFGTFFLRASAIGACPGA